MTATEFIRIGARIVCDSSGFKSGLNKAESDAKSFTSRLEGIIGKAKTVLKAAGITTAVYKVSKSIWNLANETSAYGDQVDKASQKLGISTKAYQQWDYVLGQNGASIESMTTAFTTLKNGMTDGTKEYKRSIKALGLAYKDISHMSTEQAFAAIVKQLQEMPESAQKSALAVDLFGKSATELMPLLNQSAESTEELMKRAEELGIIMSEEDIASAAAFNDALDDMGRAFTSIKYKFGTQLMPILTKGMNKITDAAITLMPLMTEALQTGDWTEFISGLTASLDEILPQIGTALGDFIIGLINNSDQIIDAAFDIAESLIKALGKAIPVLVSKLPEILKGLWQGFTSLISGLGDAIFAALGLSEEQKTAIKTWFSDVFSGAAEPIQAIIDKAGSIISTIGALIKGDVDGKEAIQTVFTDIFGDGGIIKSMFDSIASIGGNILSSIGEALGLSEESTEGIKTAFEGVFGSEGIIASYFDYIVGSGGAILKGISGLLTGDLDSIESVDAIFDGLFGAQGSVTKYINGIVTSGGKIITGIYNAISGDDATPEDLKNWISTNITTPISDFFSNVVTSAGNIVTDIYNAIIQSPENIATWFNTNIIAPISGWIDSIVNAGSNIVSDIYTGLSNTTVSISEWFNTNIVQPVVSLWNNFVSTLTSGINSVLSFFGMGGIDGTISIGGGTAGKATGLDYVPYDGFGATLHKGETVLNRFDAENYRNGVGLQNGSSPQEIASAVAEALRGLTVQMDGRTVGELVADTVSESIGMNARQRRFG